MTEHVKQRHLFAKNRVLHAWSVYFPEGVSPEGVREDLARNMVAQVSVPDGEGEVRNDFDRLEIYRRPIFNATWDNAACRWVDLVAQGEEGFTFSPAEPNREVVYRCTPFWYKIDYSGANGPSFISVTDRPLQGYRLAPMFKDANTYEYRPCFEMALGNDGKPHSRAGLTPMETSPAALMDKAHLYDANAHTETMADWFSDYLLLLVEFGTRNLQGIIKSATCASVDIQLYYEDEYFVPSGFYTSTPDTVPIGFSMLMQYWDGTKTVIETVEIASIDTEETSVGYRVTFKNFDEEFLIEQQQYPRIYHLPRNTGSALPHITNASSGYRKDNGRYVCAWRGKENPWGNYASLVCDMLFNINDFCEVEIHRLTDLKHFDGTLNEHYVMLALVEEMPPTQGNWGVVKRYTCLGEDHIMIPCESSFEGKNQYWATCVWMLDDINAEGIRFLRVGGSYETLYPANHGCFEMYGGEKIDKFGARLILEEAV